MENMEALISEDARQEAFTGVLPEEDDSWVEEFNRASRETQTRDLSKRKNTYKPPELLPMPDPEPGWKFRYIRRAVMGQQDTRNMVRKAQEGWELCRPEDYPKIAAMSAMGNIGKSYIEFNGLVLAKIPEELAKAKREYLDGTNRDQIESVDNTYFSLNDRGVETFRDPDSKVFRSRRR